jgi:hypothetical protein
VCDVGLIQFPTEPSQHSAPRAALDHIVGTPGNAVAVYIVGIVALQDLCFGHHFQESDAEHCRCDAR